MRSITDARGQTPDIGRQTPDIGLWNLESGIFNFPVDCAIVRATSDD